MDSIPQGSRSTFIEMTLIADGREHKVSRSGRDYLVLKEDATVSAGPAVFSITVDGDRTDYPFEIEEDSVGVHVQISAIRSDKDTSSKPLAASIASQ